MSGTQEATERPRNCLGVWPVVRDIEGGLLITDGLLEALLSKHKLGAGIPLSRAGSLSLADVLLNSDPSLQAVLPF